MTIQPPLWPDGWAVEPCGTADTSDGLDPHLTAYLNQIGGGGQGRASGGPRRWVYLDKPICKIELRGDLL